MPQVQPGQAIIPGQAGAPELYGTQKVENTIPFQERLMRLFKPQEFVTIKNVDDEPVYWQYMPIDNEQENFSEDGIQKMINRADPEMWVIMPGEVEVVVGASAYRALDVMYKNVTAKKTLKRFSDPTAPQFNKENEHLPKNFNFADGGLQENFIKAAYLGKATPVFTGQEPAVAPTVAAPIAPMAQIPPTSPSEPVAPPIQPMVAQPPASPAPPVVDPTIPVPKTTEGAPLKPVTYADGDLPDETDTTQPSSGGGILGAVGALSGAEK
jgi:hypothetical protein